MWFQSTAAVAAGADAATVVVIPSASGLASVRRGAGVGAGVTGSADWARALGRGCSAAAVPVGKAAGFTCCCGGACIGTCIGRACWNCGAGVKGIIIGILPNIGPQPCG